VKKIQKAVKEGKAKFAGDVSLYDPSLSPEEAKRKKDWPEFVSISIEEPWTKWRRGKKGNNGGFNIHWGAKGVGFGEITFFLDKENKIHCRSECMGKVFVRQALATMVDQCVWDE
jgi:hypothetical protein